MYKLGLSSCDKKISAELFENYKKTGIEAIEISVSSIEQCEALDFDLIDTLSDEFGIELWSFHLPFMPFGQIDISSEALADYSISYLEGVMEKASAIGIKRFIIHPSGEPIDDADRPKRMERAKKSLAILAEIAQKYDAVIAVEDLPRTCLGNCASDMIELISAHPELKVCFDTNHLLFEDPVYFIHALGDKIITTHISDYDFVNERHWLPGEGKIDWQAIIKALEEINYNGVWLYEIDFKAPKTIIRERDLVCEDFATNARELFEGKEPTVLSNPKPNLGFWE
ncbi:MAG: sugar phosphate isomerase/epimerase [Clostridia bacterium]|nr:sugar phosphate isomerase/epimerase [Clostridia bacterium]